MRSPSALLASAALLLPAALGANETVSWCTTTDKVVLTSCGSLCNVEQPCVQYPAKAGVECSESARNLCKASPEVDSCTYQCLEPYNLIAGTWKLFVKDPAASDGFATDTGRTKTFPAAPVQLISGTQVPAEATDIQITGFNSVDIAKGTTKELKRDDDFFALAKLAKLLVFTNINLAQLQTNFLPTSLEKLYMDNCALTDVPADVANMPNLRELNVSKNAIVDLPTADSKLGKALQSVKVLSLRGNALTKFDLALQSVETLDLSDNKLTAFPTAVFNMTQLTALSLSGNLIQATNFTASQLLFLQRLKPVSTLGLTARACGTGEKEATVLGTTVCVVDASGATPATESDKKSGSSSVVIIVCCVAGALLLVGGGAFIWHRRRAKTSEFYDAVMDNQNSRSNPTANHNNYNSGTNNNNSGTGQSRTGGFFSRGRATSGGRSSSVSGPGGRPSNASARPSAASRPSKPSFSAGTYTEIAKYQEERQSAAATSSMPLTAGGSRQRERAQINQNVVRISSQDINYTRTIAKGAFGEVWLAHYGRDLVAVKKLLSSDPTSVGDFIAELNLLASLSHPRILALVGACWDDKQLDLQIVMEYMDSGDLLTVLRRHSPTELSWENGKATYCVQVCEAVFYLHSLQPALIHRDIKSRNILIDERKGAKLSDFGESRERTVMNTMTAGVGTARWVAPEIILGEDYSELADIYSLGVLLTELDTHKIPFEGMNLEEHMIVQQVSVGKLRPKVSDSCPDVIRRLVHECLQFDPQLRPSAARVLQTLMQSPLARRLSTISDNE